jgi:hypothetical protein
MAKFIFTFLLLISGVSQAQQAVTLRGLVDCGNWIKARSTQPAAAYYETAIQSYINGLSMASNIDIWSWGGNKMSEQQAFLYIDGYCQKHPLEDIWQAGWVLANEKTQNALTNQLKKKR